MYHYGGQRIDFDLTKEAYEMLKELGKKGWTESNKGDLVSFLSNLSEDDMSPFTRLERLGLVKRWYGIFVTKKGFDYINKNVSNPQALWDLEK